MASKKDIQILIDIETKNQKVLGDLNNQLKAMGNVSKDAKSGTNDLFGSIVSGNLVAQGLTKTLSLLSGAFQSLANTMSEATVKSAQNQQLMMGFARNFGNDVTANLDKLREASKGTIADMGLMQSANKASLLGVTSNVEELAGLMQTARLRGREMGMDSTQAFNDIVTGIGRGSPLILDNLGIKIPEALKTSMEAMSETEKMQTLLNFAIQDGKDLASQYGEQQLSVADQFQVLSASGENVLNSLGSLGTTFLENSGILSTLSGVMDQVKAGLDWLTLAFDGMWQVVAGAIQPALDRLSQAWVEYTGNIDISGDSLNQFMDFMTNVVANGLTFIIEIITKIIEVSTWWQKTWESLSQTAQQTGNTILDVAQTLIDGIQGMVDGVIGGIESAINSALQGVISLINGTIRAMQMMAKPLKKLGVDMGDFGSVKADNVSLGRVGKISVKRAVGELGMGALGGGGGLDFKMGEAGKFDFKKQALSLGGGGTGGTGGKSAKDKELEDAKKLEEEKAKIAEEALRQLEEARIQAIEDEDKRRIEMLKLSANREIEAFKGTEEQKKEFKKLVDAKLQREIEVIKAKSMEKEKQDAKKQAKDLTEIQKQQMAENINFYGVRDIDTAISKLQAFVEKGLSAKLLNNALGS